jgi:hypothetical protein
VLDQLRPGDTLVVWRLDRLGRSIRHLIDVVGELGERGVGFQSLTEAIDTTTAGGRLLFHVLASLAEFERQLIQSAQIYGVTVAAKMSRLYPAGARRRSRSACLSWRVHCWAGAPSSSGLQGQRLVQWRCKICYGAGIDEATARAATCPRTALSAVSYSKLLSG